MTRTQKILVLAALLLAAFLRSWNVTSLELTHWDEGVYVGFAQGYGPGFRGDPWIIYAPPVYPALIAIAFAILGAQPWVAIAVSGVIGVFGVFLVSRLSAAWFGPRAGVIAAFLLAIEPLHVAHSRLALTETTFCAGLLLTLLFATRALQAARNADAVRVGGWAGLAALTKFHGFLPLAAYGIVALVKKRWGNAMIAGLGFLPAALLGAWIVHHTCGFERFAESRQQWVNGLRPWSIRQTLEFAWVLIVDHSTIMIAASAAIGAIVLPFTKPRSAGPWLGLLTLLLLGLVLCTYRNYARLFVPAIVLAIPYAACAIVRNPSRPETPTSSAISGVIWTVLIVAVSVPRLHEIVRFHGAGYANMAKFVREELAAHPGAEIVAVAQQSLFPYLDESTTTRVFSINEQEAIDRLEDESANYLLTDQDPWRHGRASPFRERLEPRLVEVARVDNPLPAATYLDRLGMGWRSRGALGDGRPALDAERFLILYRIDWARR